MNYPKTVCDVFKRNMIDRYIDRPNTASLGGKYKMLDTFCYANFVSLDSESLLVQSSSSDSHSLTNVIRHW